MRSLRRWRSTAWESPVERWIGSGSTSFRRRSGPTRNAPNRVAEEEQGDPFGANARVSHNLDLGPASRHTRLQGRFPAPLSPLHRSGNDLFGRRHHRLLASEEVLVLAAGAQRRDPKGPTKGPQGDAGRLRPGES